MNTWRKIALAGLLLAVARAHAEDIVHYYYTDPQGTVLAKTDAAGNVIARYDYAPYGSQAMGTPPASGPTGYTGHVNDPDTGLVYMQQRYYDPERGGFLSVDPVGPAPGNPFNFNRYGYANNNPVVNMDPDGRCTGSHNAHSDGTCFGAGGHTTLPHSLPKGGRGNLINPAVGHAAERDANKALEGVAQESKNADTLVRGWANVVQPIAEKYDTEIASKNFHGHWGRVQVWPSNE